MKKLFSGVIGIPLKSKFISALIIPGIHIIMTGISNIKKILERRIFLSSIPTNDKKLIQNTSLLSDI